MPPIYRKEREICNHDDHYNHHADDYILADKISKVIFVKTSIMAPKLDSLETWLFDEDTLFIDAIETYCHQYSKRFYYNSNEWLSLIHI